MPSAINGASFVSNMNGTTPVIKTFQEGTGQSYKAGQLVKLSAGQVVITSGNANEKILGLAMKDASGTATTAAPVLILSPDVIFRMSAYHVNPGSAVTAIANIGSQTQFLHSSNKSVVDVAHIGTHANAPLVIVGYDTRHAVGTQYGFYLCKVIPDHFDLSGL